jgi:hypothetical protein
MSIPDVLAAMNCSPQRHHQFVYADGGEFVSEHEGREVRAGNPFGLDSKLTAIGMPAPANLYLVERSDIPTLEAARAVRSQAENTQPTNHPIRSEGETK